MAQLPASVWECRFDDDHGPFVIRWTASGHALMNADLGSYAEDRLDGSESPISAGDPLDVTTTPIKINLRSTN